MRSAHVAFPRLSFFELRLAVHLLSQVIAKPLAQSIVLVIIRINLALTLAALALLSVRVHLEEQLVAENAASLISNDFSENLLYFEI